MILKSVGDRIVLVNVSIDRDSNSLSSCIVYAEQTNTDKVTLKDVENHEYVIETPKDFTDIKTYIFGLNRSFKLIS